MPPPRRSCEGGESLPRACVALLRRRLTVEPAHPNAAVLDRPSPDRGSRPANARPKSCARPSSDRCDSTCFRCPWRETRRAASSARRRQRRASAPSCSEFHARESTRMPPALRRLLRRRRRARAKRGGRGDRRRFGRKRRSRRDDLRANERAAAVGTAQHVHVRRRIDAAARTV